MPVANEPTLCQQIIISAHAPTKTNIGMRPVGPTFVESVKFSKSCDQLAVLMSSSISNSMASSNRSGCTVGGSLSHRGQLGVGLPFVVQ